MSEKTVINIDDVPLMDRGNGKQFAVKWGRVGPLVGLNGLGCAVHVVPPGKKAFPFHRHHVMDELFFVVSGEGEYRFGDTAVPVRSGDVVDYPDSKKIAVAAGVKNADFKTATYVGLGRIAPTDYYDGEDG